MEYKSRNVREAYLEIIDLYFPDAAFRRRGTNVLPLDPTLLS